MNRKSLAATAVAAVAAAIAMVSPAKASDPVPVGGSQYAGSMAFSYSGTDIKNNWLTGTAAIDQWLPGDCSRPNGATVTVPASGTFAGDLDLYSTGKKDSCALAASKDAYTEGVTEYRIDVPANGSNISLWPAAWMAGDDWPANGEIDGYEGNQGTDYSSYYYGPSESAVYGQTTGYPWSGGGYQTVNVGGVKAGPGPGWHTIDIARTKTAVYVYNDGALYATFQTNGKSVVDGDMPEHILLDITNDNGDNGYGRAPSHMYVQYVRQWVAP